MKHMCHAIGCDVAVPPAMLMCRRHWYMVPADIRDRIWRAYVPGQEITKTPTRHYLSVMDEAIQAVAKREGR